MGARVRIYEQTAVIEGVPQLHGAAVEATDPVSYTHLDVYKRQACVKSC